MGVNRRERLGELHRSRRRKRKGPVACLRPAALHLVPCVLPALGVELRKRNLQRRAVGPLEINERRFRLSVVFCVDRLRTHGQLPIARSPNPHFRRFGRSANADQQAQQRGTDQPALLSTVGQTFLSAAKNATHPADKNVCPTGPPVACLLRHGVGLLLVCARSRAGKMTVIPSAAKDLGCCAFSMRDPSLRSG